MINCLPLSLLAAVFLSFPTVTAEICGCEACELGLLHEPKTEPKIVEAQSVADLALTDRQLSKFGQLLRSSGLLAELASAGPFTLFAPSNVAIENLSAETRDRLTKPENQDELIALIKQHVVRERLLAKEIKKGPLATWDGVERSARILEKSISIDEAQVIKTDLLGNNGIVHIIDRLLPLKARSDQEKPTEKKGS